MIAKLFIASMLAGSGVAISAHGPARTVEGSAKAVWPHMHQCTLDAVSKLAIKTKGTSAHRGGLGGESNTAGWSRIDLHLAGSSYGSGGPTIHAHAINTKGTGAAGRAGVINQIPIGVDCVTSHVTGDEAAQKAALSSFAFTSADGKGAGWSCSVSGSEDAPVFRIGLLVPTILGQAERRVDYSLSGHGGRVSIVARGVEHSDSWHVACSSKEPRNTNYDLAVLKKV